ncbi:30S ribosomal protein S4e [Candidatus Norongarragalina meridionalis]|nr:30S ribosomal protein S4e [Candidatus Norongarragalina meridionalis]
MKLIAAPTARGLSPKGNVWVTKGIPGPHNAKESIPLSVFLRDVLKIAETSRQARSVVKNGELLVDGRSINDEQFCIGLMDVVSIPKLGTHYRIVIKAGVLKPIPITAEEAKLKYCRVQGKRFVAKGKTQLNLHDGRCVILDKTDAKPGDTLVVSVPKQEIKAHLKFEKGARCLVFRGKHSGFIANLEGVMERAGSKDSDARLTGDMITLKNYLFVVDDKFKIE